MRECVLQVQFYGTYCLHVHSIYTFCRRESDAISCRTPAWEVDYSQHFLPEKHRLVGLPVTVHIDNSHLQATVNFVYVANPVVKRFYPTASCSRFVGELILSLLNRLIACHPICSMHNLFAKDYCPWALDCAVALTSHQLYTVAVRTSHLVVYCCPQSQS